jgi:hypothetical protein
VSTTQREVPESGSEAPASGGAIEQAQEKVGAEVEQAKSSAGSLIRSQVDERSSQLGEQLHGAGQALRQHFWRSLLEGIEFAALRGVPEDV